MSKDLIQALEEALSVCQSVNTGRHHRVVRDGSVHYLQTEEWCKWAEEEVAPALRQAISRHRSSVGSVELDARRYRLLRDFDSADTELAICRWSEHGWCGEWVIEHDPDTEVDKALAKREAK